MAARYVTGKEVFVLMYTIFVYHQNRQKVWMLSLMRALAHARVCVGFLDNLDNLNSF